MPTSTNPFDDLYRQLTAIQEQNREILSRLEKTDHSSDEIGGIKLAKEVTGLSEPRIYTLVSERKIPHSKRGNRLFFTRGQLTQWVLQGNRELKREAEA